MTVFLSLDRLTAQKEEEEKKKHRFWLCTKPILLIEAYLKTQIFFSTIILEDCLDFSLLFRIISSKSAHLSKHIL